MTLSQINDNHFCIPYQKISLTVTFVDFDYTYFINIYKSRNARES